MGNASASTLNRQPTPGRPDDVGDGTGAVPADPASDINEVLEVARSVADKFLIRCLMDEEVRSFFQKQGVAALKAHFVEILVAAMRQTAETDVPLSLEAARGLTENRLELLRKHFTEAVQEHAAASTTSAFAGDDVTGVASSLSERLLLASPLPLALLPKEELAEDSVSSRTLAMERRGGGGNTTKLGALEVAPVNVPLVRRRQMLCCTLVSSAIPEMLLVYALLIRFRRRLWPLMLMYLPWLCWDKAPWTGGRGTSKWLRRNAIFSHFAAYFPASLIKAEPEADFSGTRPVMMGYHPHGILSFGALLNYGTDATGWHEKFPKLTPRLATLSMNFRFPIMREILASMGLIAASAGSIRKALKPGAAVIVVVGGAAEALDTKPGEYVLTLTRRTGFFRIALEMGADLVPTFGFGENDIFDTVLAKGSTLHKLQLRMYKMMSFSLPIFHGRTAVTYNMGTLPYRRPLTVVVGEPIRNEQVDAPTAAQIADLKARYVQAVRDLYSKWQPRLEPGREKALIIL